MKRFPIFIAVLLLSQLACQFVMGTPVPTQTPLPTPIPLPTQPPPPAPEDINAGTHLYWRETVEAGCEASDDSKGTEYTEKTHIFSSDFTSVEYGGRWYQ